ncbi:MAG: hypothetical protein SPLM_10550 [Spiroplasma phoeniceum]|uniref:lipoprotein n=1 Tax=Spiroplasma phoeniceum TaxID=47835 RepID=UPI00313406F5
MKKLLSIIGTISLVGTSTTSLVACNKPQYSKDELKKEKEKHKIDTKDQTIRDNLEWMAPQEKPFDKVDNKYYYVVSRTSKDKNWHISKFENNIHLNDNEGKTIDSWDENVLELKNKGFGQVNLRISGNGWTYWWKTEDNYFKSVYCWTGEEQKLPNLDINNDGNIIVKN